ncbi:MAG: T9SS type A sorting domain-containing protein [Bacteroidetes bacterium]|jgi:hypothetical protein|nr:T9SS type A sorting domain-containing protein [Bacteroidota bacterium]
MKALLILFALLITETLYAQRTIPQEKIQSMLSQLHEMKKSNFEAAATVQKESDFRNSPFQLLDKYNQLQQPLSVQKSGGNTTMSVDTIVVGAVPNDTLVISGLFTHTGLIFVMNDGVLIFKNAQVIDTGDVYVVGNGKLFADSTNFFFPQEYIYQRSLMFLQNSAAIFNHCNFNFSGMSHNLILGDSANVVMNNIHQNDFTTCGLWGPSSLHINQCNLTGEYIMMSGSQASFTNCDTLLLWYNFPDSSVIDYSFPQGDTVYNYTFNNTIPGINGINYSVEVDSCHTVWWGIMPVNGSDVTISNSNLRTVGVWFQKGDTALAQGIFNNSNYINYVTPLSDRNLHLINSYVQTWSLYVFDSSQIVIDSCQLGEVGCQQKSSAITSNFLLDGSGGYFWATDTSFIFASGVTIYTLPRSERNGIFLLAYSWVPFLMPQAIGQSVMICVQNNLSQDPIPFDGAVAWLQNIASPDTALVQSVAAITGDAWIDQGPAGSWMDFQSYSVSYQLMGDTIWHNIVADSLNEVRHSNLALWNTNGLAAGDYMLRLVIKNNLGDSIEAKKPIYLRLSPVAVSELANNYQVRVFPNPTVSVINFEINTVSAEKNLKEISIKNILGKTVFEAKNIAVVNHKVTLNHSYVPGVYFYQLKIDNEIVNGKFLVAK